MNMASENKTCSWSLGYCILRCWGTAWILIGLFFLIVGSISMGNGERQYLGMVIVSIWFIMIGGFTWYYLLMILKNVEKRNSDIDSEDTDGSIIPKKKTVASALFMFGAIFNSIGMMAYQSNGFTDFSSPDLEPLWPRNIVWLISMIPIFVSFAIFFEIEEKLRYALELVRKCLVRPDASTSVSPEINTIEIESAQETHTAITIPQAVYTPPPQKHQSNFYFFK